MDPVRINESTRTAVALALAQLHGDSAAMVELWNATDDTEGLANAVTALPSLVAEAICRQAGIEVDLDASYRGVLRNLAVPNN